MHILLVADGRSPITRRWVRAVHALGHRAGKNGPIHIELANVDYQVSLLIDGQAVARTTPQQYAPDVVAAMTDMADRLESDFAALMGPSIGGGSSEVTYAAALSSSPRSAA